VLAVSAPVWVRWLTPGFQPDQQQLVVSLIHWLVLGMVLQGVSGAVRASWNAKHRFVYPAIVSMVAALASLVFLIVTIRRLGVMAAAYAFDVRFFVECVMLLPRLGAMRRFGLAREALPRLLRDGRPLMLGALYARTDVLVDRVLASMAPVGSLALLYLAQQILSAAGQVLNQTFVAPASPVLAQLAHVSDWEGFRRALRSRAGHIALIVGCMAIAIPFSGPVLRLIFAHKNMNPGDIHQLTMIMIALSGLLVGDSLAYLANTGYYALRDTRTPALATGIVYSIAVPVKIGVFALTGIVGLAACTSGYYVVNLFVLAYLLTRRVRRLSRQHASVSGAPVFAAPTPEALP
jgi:peptidoglycan biosynthesis protein MviN/MurJ (putative lipid II flippase)